MEFRERRRSRNNGGKRFSLDGRFRVGRGWLNASLTARFETIIALRLRGNHDTSSLLRPRNIYDAVKKEAMSSFQVWPPSFEVAEKC